MFNKNGYDWGGCVHVRIDFSFLGWQIINILFIHLTMISFIKVLRITTIQQTLTEGLRFARYPSRHWVKRADSQPH